MANNSPEIYMKILENLTKNQKIRSNNRKKSNSRLSRIGGKVADVLGHEGGAFGWGLEKIGVAKTTSSLKEKVMKTRVGKGLGTAIKSIVLD
ncbi:MAG: hypothetical protein SVK08_00885 [Halobacteriota archaeon]|nr:hypothetical protein [Halobacteriota archaeon]